MSGATSAHYETTEVLKTNHKSLNLTLYIAGVWAKDITPGWPYKSKTDLLGRNGRILLQAVGGPEWGGGGVCYFELYH